MTHSVSDRPAGVVVYPSYLLTHEYELIHIYIYNIVVFQFTYFEDFK